MHGSEFNVEMSAPQPPLAQVEHSTAPVDVKAPSPVPDREYAPEKRPSNMSMVSTTVALALSLHVNR